MAQKLAVLTAEMQPVPERATTKTRAGKVRLRSLNDLDHRTAAAQRAANLVANIITDLGSDPTTAQKQLAQRAAILSAILEDYETKWIEGGAIDLTEYGFLTNAQRRVLATIGLERVAKDITPFDLNDAIKRARQSARQQRGGALR